MEENKSQIKNIKYPQLFYEQFNTTQANTITTGNTIKYTNIKSGIYLNNNVDLSFIKNKKNLIHLFLNNSTNKKIHNSIFDEEGSTVKSKSLESIRKNFEINPLFFDLFDKTTAKKYETIYKEDINKSLIKQVQFESFKKIQKNLSTEESSFIQFIPSEKTKCNNPPLQRKISTCTFDKINTNSNSNDDHIQRNSLLLKKRKKLEINKKIFEFKQLNCHVNVQFIKNEDLDIYNKLFFSSGKNQLYENTPVENKNKNEMIDDDNISYKDIDEKLNYIFNDQFSFPKK